MSTVPEIEGQGYSGLIDSPSSATSPDVCPIDSKRATRRASASLALTGKVS